MLLKENKMAIEFNREAYNKVFDDLERFKSFCATAYLYGHNGYVWDEANLYNNKSPAWQAYTRFRNGGKRRNNDRNNNYRGNNDRNNNFRGNNNGGRFQGNRGN